RCGHGFRNEAAPQFLDERAQFGNAEAAAAVILRHEQAGPPQRADLGPDLPVIAGRLEPAVAHPLKISRSADDRFGALPDELDTAAALFGEILFHALVLPVAVTRPSRRSPTRPPRGGPTCRRSIGLPGSRSGSRDRRKWECP